MTVEHGWMRIVLDALFDDIAVADAEAAIAGRPGLVALRETLQRDTLAAGKLGMIPAGDRGDNLLQGIIALRLKFPREIATEKLELNIAMRSGRI